ncbi:MAG TPA: hypothetical protein VGL59_06750 [Polyangia bacterium]|jgi:hypothetical protein
MNRILLGIVSLAAAMGIFAACSSSSSGGRSKDGGGADGSEQTDVASGADSSAADGSSASDAQGDSTIADGGSPASDGGSGPDGNPCVNPQLTFGKIGQGDSSQYFTSGVGARTATDLLIFDGYLGPAPGGDGGTTSVPWVYVQAFDATTGLSKGPSQPLFAVADPTREGVRMEAVAVAPSGQIALLYSHSNNPLYAAFLAPAAAADGGVAGLMVLTSNIVVAPIFTNSGGTIESSHVIWSNATQSFVMSWVGDAYVESIAEYTATGAPSPGGVEVVSTDNGTTSGNVTENCVGISGDLLAIDWQSGMPNKNQTGITVYNTQGQQVGAPTYVAPQQNGLAELAGTANGFVLVYAPETGGLTTTGVFIPTTAGGLADAGTFPTYTIRIPGGTSLGLRAISDGVGTGGAGGVGLALMGATSTSFAYVHADGTTLDGPVSVFATGYQNSSSQVSLTNINGSFVMTLFQQTANATGPGAPSLFGAQIAASGCN